MKTILTTILSAAAIVAPLPAYAQNAIRIESAWSRETPPSAKTGAGFLTITNSGSAPDRLLSISAAVAAKAEIHTMSIDGGVMRMRPLPGGIAIAPGATAIFKPDGNHIMFIGLKRAFKKGETLPVKLRFERAGTMTVRFRVLPIAAQNGGHH